MAVYTNVVFRLDFDESGRVDILKPNTIVIKVPTVYCPGVMKIITDALKEGSSIYVAVARANTYLWRAMRDDVYDDVQ